MKSVHLIVEKGVDKGKEFTVPPQGARLGRSSKNDIVLEDPLLSRHHCRVFFKNSDIYVADLGSSNHTLVNDKPIVEEKLNAGDHFTIGDTTIKVAYSGASTTDGLKSPNVDLGLHPESVNTAQKKKIGVKPLLIFAGLAIAFAFAVWIPKMINASKDKTFSTPTELEKPKTLEIDYEKIEADQNNIFRYKLNLSKDNMISIEIDDVINKRTVRKEKTVDNDLLESLIRQIENSGFFDMNTEYTGIQPDVLNQANLSITIDRLTHNVKVQNRPEPEAFKDLRERIEVFGKNELGLWAIQFSTEKLIEMANEEYLLGKKMFAEREVKYSNLADALSNFKKTEIDLETVEPKPDFYADAIASQEECKKILSEKYNELNFQAERSMRLKEWSNAANSLRIIQELVPDRSDERNQQARKNLLNVEEHMKIRN